MRNYKRESHMFSPAAYAMESGKPSRQGESLPSETAIKGYHSLLKGDCFSARADTSIFGAPIVHANLHAAPLAALALQRAEGKLSADGSLVVRTGTHTGRSARDKFIVDEPETSTDVWWGNVNQKLSPAHFAALADHVRGYLQGQVLFTQDLYAGAIPTHRIRVRLITTNAWHALFARNMFIRPPTEGLEDFTPDYTILHAPDFAVDPARCGLRSSTAIALSLAQKLIVISGTEYAGEIKKAVFTLMNWLLPAKGVLPLHCSANIGPAGDTALFFGLSGTGKTTLSSDPERRLIGDDEHAWSSEGVFNFEGGCYAKIINLRRKAEPEIWAASHRFGTVLENVPIDADGRLDLDDETLTPNTRACYPLDFIGNVEPSGLGEAPRNIVMLTADAFGVMPPLARLTPAQAMFHFLSGYTARIAGTEKGLGKEPSATFSACFGAPFLPRPPQVYCELLRRYLSESKAVVWLVNTGWIGGPYGIGERISIAHTRALVRAALGGTLEGANFRAEPYFALSVPQHVPGVPDEILHPALAWPNLEAYAAQARKLVALFEENFKNVPGNILTEPSDGNHFWAS
jgi:phosphoenolpyruvate carboxykinase (ATP)